MSSFCRSLTTRINDHHSASSMEPPRASTSSTNPQRSFIPSPMGQFPHDFFNYLSGTQWAWEHPSFTESDTQPLESQDLDMQMFDNPSPLLIEQLLPNEGQTFSKQPNEEPSSSRRNSKRQRTNNVWQVFEIINIVGNCQKALCKFCKKDYSCQPGDGTGHLIRHALKHDDGGLDATRTQLQQGYAKVHN
ncbi:uncharacterized protein LOC127806641 [Diospyros lotus]|uniref:uncharacterized protein LOC127806641 n=1 Tax=Diospyros lotus TaxID=55363 RepID=UPI00224F2082|nr:uncharacterized protein LOC127806641 [Diospyros lotus]